MGIDAHEQDDCRNARSRTSRSPLDTEDDHSDGRAHSGARAIGPHWSIRSGGGRRDPLHQRTHKNFLDCLDRQTSV